MSRANAKRAYVALGLTIFFVPLCTMIALEHAGQSLFKEYLSWALVGILSVGFVTMPAVLFGYHNRHQIDTSDVEEGYDLSDAYRAGIAAAAGVPMIRAIFDWLA